MVVGDSNSTKSLPGLSICYHHPSIIIIYKHQAVDTASDPGHQFSDRNEFCSKKYVVTSQFKISIYIWLLMLSEQKKCHFMTSSHFVRKGPDQLIVITRAEFF